MDVRPGEIDWLLRCDTGHFGGRPPTDQHIDRDRIDQGHGSQPTSSKPETRVNPLSGPRSPCTALCATQERRRQLGADSRDNPVKEGRKSYAPSPRLLARGPGVTPSKPRLLARGFSLPWRRVETTDTGQVRPEARGSSAKTVRAWTARAALQDQGSTLRVKSLGENLKSSANLDPREAQQGLRHSVVLKNHGTGGCANFGRLVIGGSHRRAKNPFCTTANRIRSRFKSGLILNSHQGGEKRQRPAGPRQRSHPGGACTTGEAERIEMTAASPPLQQRQP